ncbi:MAG TPA: hypothetical protein VK589_30160 [Chryseolinea sp.]|nr:hypothetical protein [Chryseolinea sp.]
MSKKKDDEERQNFSPAEVDLMFWQLWEGTTENGIPMHAFITRVAVARDQDATEFEKTLQEHTAPSVEIQANSFTHDYLKLWHHPCCIWWWRVLLPWRYR